MNFTPLDADQLTRAVYFVLFLRFSIPGEEEGDGVVTRNDLSEFRTFLLEQLKAHNSELLAKFNKATNTKKKKQKKATNTLRGSIRQSAAKEGKCA